MADEHPKIIVDDDWKSQARAEKEKLAQQAERAKAEAGGKGGPGRVPAEVSFDDLVRMFASQALMYMGALPDPQSGKAVVALDIAKLNIDLLGILEEKTKGNLTDEESQTLSSVLHELRIQFVEVRKVIDKAVAEGRIGPDGSIAPEGGPAGGMPGVGPIGGPGGTRGGGPAAP